MITYNFSAEYAALIILCAILVSFSRDFDSDTIEYRFLKSMYLVALGSILITIAALVSGVPGTGTLHLTVARVSNVLYFIFIPVVSLSFLIFTKLITVLKFNRQDIYKKLFPVTIPYLLYLVILTIGLVSGKVFHVTEAEGYVRDDWFQLPYIVVAINLSLVLYIMTGNIKTLHRGIKKTIFATTGLALLFLCVQYQSNNTIITGIVHTACILGIHLHTLNVKKCTDQLTGLYNRMFLIQSIRAHADTNRDCSLYVFSIRGMKTINERYGIECGDLVLMRVAQIFFSHASDEAAFRYSGDEFALLLDQSEAEQDTIVTATIADLDRVQDIDGNEIAIDFIYARVDYGPFGKNARELISAADYSISDLKEGRGSTRFLYDTAVVKALIRRTDIVQQIKDALKEDGFVVHYQPIYCQETKTFTQAEALVRMRNIDGYLIYPGEFIDIAVKTGLIVQITYLILDQVCRDLRYMLDQGSEEFTIEAISVNFPYLQFADDHMQEKVMTILERHQIPPKMIKIEITEREMVTDTAMTQEIMLQMEEKGFCFELDDFGMDYSNMSVVLKLPLDTIKLDRSFLLAALEAEKNMNFFTHLVKGITSIGATIICEGVEEQEQLNFVIDSGCQYVQGYFFSKPLPREQLQEFLKMEVL